ncbi:MAG: hypothetical protein ACYDBQ_01420 [Thermoplasmatota archaeon]
MTSEIPRPATKAPRANPPMTAVHWAILIGVVLLGLALRLRDPLATGVLVAEDPYTHMEHTWDLMQGQATLTFPIGMMLVLFPFTWLGPAAFYQIARLGPPFIGAAGIVTLFFLCRRHMHPTGALTTALLMAIMPELVRRTDFLVPEGIDLLLLPVAFGILLQLPNVSRRATIALGAIVAGLFLVHPWVLALALVPVLLYCLLAMTSVPARTRLTVSGAVVAGGAVVMLALRGTVVGPSVMGNALPKLTQLATNPASFTLPQYVDLPSMLTTPALVLGVLGVVAAFRRRDRFSLLALLWVGVLLPLCLVDWFGVGFLPHRTVAYLAVGIAILAGLAISELFRLFPDAKPKAQAMLGFGALALVALLTVPSVAANPGATAWYRIFNDGDLSCWHALEANNTPYVEAGSWQARNGYRATTGRPAAFNPPFFESSNTRASEMGLHPGLAVLIDNYTVDPTNPQHLNVDPHNFLQAEGWTLFAHCGTTEAWTHG